MIFKNKNQWLFEAPAGEGSYWICPYDGQRIEFTSGPTGCSNPDCPSYGLEEFNPSQDIAESVLLEGERLSSYGYMYDEVSEEVSKNWTIYDKEGCVGLVAISDAQPFVATRLPAP